MRTSLRTALVLGMLAFSPSLAAAGDDASALEQLAIDSANTPADHAALAKYYRAKAASARANAASHESMASSYTGSKMAMKEQMQGHCQKIAQQEKATAEEYDALAKLHDDQAKKPQ
jgi:hypothetical protein